jgi:hypothetical protein
VGPKVVQNAPKCPFERPFKRSNWTPIMVSTTGGFLNETILLIGFSCHYSRDIGITEWSLEAILGLAMEE